MRKKNEMTAEDWLIMVEFFLEATKPGLFREWKAQIVLNFGVSPLTRIDWLMAKGHIPSIFSSLIKRDSKTDWLSISKEWMEFIK